MLLTQTEMIYARGVKDLLCNPRYRLGASPQINPETEWWTRLGMVANDSMSIPLVTLLPASGGGSALTLCLDPTETLL